MQIRAVYTRWVPIMIATASLLALVAMTPRYSTADTISCAGGGTSHTATVDEAAASSGGGIIAGVTQVCPSDTKLGISNQSGAAKLDLNKMTCNAGVNISSLDNKFAICADKFMQQLRSASPGACITSAYRSVQQQAAACVHICGASGAIYGCPGTCAVPGKSYHQKGLAIDVSFNSISNSEAWQLAISSTNGGLLNPSGLHSSDPRHFQASGSDCSLGGVATSTQTDTYTPSAATISSGQTTTNTVTAACTAQFSCSGMMLLYTNSSCQQQTVQYCQYGCLGNACASQSSSSSGTSGTTQTSSGTTGSSGSSGTTYTAGSGCTSYQPTSDQSVAASNKCYYYTGGSSTTSTQSSSLLTTTSGSSTTGSSAIDLLNILAGSTTSASSGTTTSTPIALNNNLGQSSDISATSPGTTDSDGITTVAGSGYDSGSGDVTGSESSSTRGGGAVSTFTSGDLSNNGSFATTSSNATFMARALSELNVLKAQLVSALSFLGQYLKPFGGISIPDQG